MGQGFQVPAWFINDQPKLKGGIMPMVGGKNIPTQSRYEGICSKKTEKNECQEKKK